MKFRFVSEMELLIDFEIFYFSHCKVHRFIYQSKPHTDMHLWMIGLDERTKSRSPLLENEMNFLSCNQISNTRSDCGEVQWYLHNHSLLLRWPYELKSYANWKIDVGKMKHGLPNWNNGEFMLKQSLTIKHSAILMLTNSHTYSKPL